MLDRIKDFVERNPTLSVVIGGVVIFVGYLVIRMFTGRRTQEQRAFPVQVAPPAPWAGAPARAQRPLTQVPDRAAPTPPTQVPDRAAPTPVPEQRREVYVQPREAGTQPGWQEAWADWTHTMRQELDNIRQRLQQEQRPATVVAAVTEVRERIPETVPARVSPVVTQPEWREVYPGVAEQVTAPITDIIRQILPAQPVTHAPVAREFRPEIDPMFWQIEIDPGPVW